MEEDLYTVAAQTFKVGASKFPQIIPLKFSPAAYLYMTHLLCAFLNKPPQMQVAFVI